MPVSDELLLKIAQEGAENVAGDLNKVATSLDGVTQSEKETVTAETAHAKSSISLKGTMTELKAGFDLAGMSVGKLGELYNTLVGDTVKYAGEVKDLALNLSLSSEETSKLLSIGQKFGVSNDTITNSLQMMVKRGMAPSLDGLAKIADEMMSIQDPVKRSAALTEMFGRNWTALMPILEKGGAAIKAAGVEAEKFGLVLSQKDSDAVEKLEIASNTLGMKLDGLKTKIGTALVPALNDAVDSFDALTSGVSATGDEVEMKLTRAISVSALAFGTESQQVKQLSQTLQDYLIIRQQVGMTEQEHTTRIAMGQVRALQEVTSWTHASSEGLKELALANQAGGQAQQDFNKWLNDEMNAAASAALSMKELTTQTIYNTAAAGLNANQALVLAEKMGLVDKGALGAANAIESMKQKLKDGKATSEDYAASIIRIQDAIAGLKDKNVKITLETIQKEITQQQNEQLRDSYGHLRAYGGAVGAGVPYIINERMGGEGFIPQQAGIVIPNNVTTTITNNIMTDRMGVALAMARAQQMAAEARM